MRDNATWSDGQKVTADDVAYTFTLIKSNDALNANAIPFGKITVNGSVVHVTFDEPQFVNQNKIMAQTAIVPKHIWEKRAINTDANKVPVVGTGAYQAVEWKTGEYVRFVRNPNYQGPTPKSYQDETFIQFFKDEGALALISAGRGDGGTIFLGGNNANRQPDVTDLGLPQVVIALE